MIYFAQAEGTDLVKIGFTAGDPAKRVKELQTGCPHALTLLASVEGTEQDEGKWHKDFASDRVKGEWFRMSWRLCLAIARAEARCSSPSSPTPPANVPPWQLREDLTEKLLDCCKRRYPILAVHLTKASAIRYGIFGDLLDAILIEFPDSKKDNALKCMSTDCSVWLRRAMHDAFGIPPGALPQIFVETESESFGGSERLRGGQGILFRDIEPELEWEGPRCPKCRKAGNSFCVCEQNSGAH